MATRGMRPVCAIYSTFLQRAYDQIIHDVCLQNLPVTFCLDRAGLSPNDGPTHHGLFDLSYLRCVPNGVIMQPVSTDELHPMIELGVNSNSPTFIRYPKGTGAKVNYTSTAYPLSLGKAACLKEGKNLAIWALGDFVSIAEQLHQHLNSLYGIDITVVNGRFVKPLDEKLLMKHALSHERIITLEDNVLAGGFGSAVVEFLQDSNIQTPVSRIGWPDKFIPHGTDVDALRRLYGLDFQGILNKVLPHLSPDIKSAKMVERT